MNSLKVLFNILYRGPIFYTCPRRKSVTIFHEIAKHFIYYYYHSTPEDNPVCSLPFVSGSQSLGIPKRDMITLKDLWPERYNFGSFGILWFFSPSIIYLLIHVLKTKTCKSYEVLMALLSSFGSDNWTSSVLRFCREF